MRFGQLAQNWNGSTETVILPSDCWTVKLTSFEAFALPTVTDMEPLHFSVRLFSLVDVVTIFSPRTYNGCCFDFSASELASLDFAIFEFLAAYWPSALLWSSETVWSTAFRVSKESHSGLASQPLRKIRKRKLPKTTVACENTASKSNMPCVGLNPSWGNRFEEALFRVARKTAPVPPYYINWRALGGSKRSLFRTRTGRECARTAASIGQPQSKKRIGAATGLIRPIRLERRAPCHRTALPPRRPVHK